MGESNLNNLKMKLFAYMTGALASLATAQRGPMPGKMPNRLPQGFADGTFGDIESPMQSDGGFMDEPMMEKPDAKDVIDPTKGYLQEIASITDIDGVKNFLTDFIVDMMERKENMMKKKKAGM